MGYIRRCLEFRVVLIRTTLSFYHVHTEHTIGFIPGMNSGAFADDICKLSASKAELRQVDLLLCSILPGKHV